MSYNNSVVVNDCITELQLINDYNSDIENLRSFLENATLTEEDYTRLKKLITSVTIKNTITKNKVIKVANKLNRVFYY